MVSSPTPNSRILFVDDDPGTRRSFSREMSLQGFLVDTAESGARALELARHNVYTSVIADLVMPAMDGDTLVSQMRREFPDTSYVLITGASNPGLSAASATVPLFSKPWDADALAQKLRLSEQSQSQASDTEPPISGKRGTGPLREISRVLVLEDQASDLHLLMRLLAQLGIAQELIDHVETLDEAYALTRITDYTVIFSDLNLPDAKGTDSVEFLCQGAPESALIVLSGLDDEDISVRAVELGAQEYIAKSQLDATSLRRTVRHALERKRADQRLMGLAHCDQLTGLANRFTFHDRLDHCLARAHRQQTRFSVLFFDLDRFKPVNDSLGHDVGDALLQQVSTRLLSLAGQGDTLARLGGDEFAMILDEPEEGERHTAMSQDILSALRVPFVLGEQTVAMSCSIGVASYPVSGNTARDLLRAADEAMYAAKRAGRGTYHHCAAAHSAEALSTLRTEQAVRRAVEEDGFELVYQPQVDLCERRVTGFEALLRCTCDGKVIPPTQFIPMLEDMGLISKVGRWVIRHACRRLRRFRDGGLGDVRMAVNVSPLQLEDPELPRTVRESLEECELPANSLEIEITESTLMRDVSRANRAIGELKAFGVRVALDDFGTGYSSLAYLHQLGIDALKIDRSFVEALGKDNQGEPIAGAIISLGLRLGLDVVAEGVETQGQVHWLAYQGCPMVQGYYFGRPASDWNWEGLGQTRERISYAPVSYPPTQTSISEFPDSTLALSGLAQIIRSAAERP